MAQEKGLFRTRRLKYGGRVQRVDEIASGRDLQTFAEGTQGSTQAALYDLDLIDYDDDANVVVKSDNVRTAAASKVKQTQSAAEAPRKYWSDAVIQQAASSGRLVSRKTAEDRVNRQEAAEANAILVAARVGGVKLTEAQQERLTKIAGGGYLDLVYSQYASGNKGTYAGTGDNERRAGLDATKAAADERRRNFYENVMQRRVRSRGAA